MLSIPSTARKQHHSCHRHPHPLEIGLPLEIVKVSYAKVSILHSPLTRFALTARRMQREMLISLQI